MIDQLRNFICAGCGGIWVRTHEPEEAIAAIHSLCKDEDWTASTWSAIDQGTSYALYPPSDTMSRTPPIEAIYLPRKQQSGYVKSLTILRNFHSFLKNPQIIATVEQGIRYGESHGAHLIVLSPVIDLPPELKERFVVVDHALPDSDELLAIATNLAEGLDDVEMPPEGEERTKLLESLSGLTREQAIQALSLSASAYSCFVARTIWELKAQSLSKDGFLTLHRGEEGFEDLGGLATLKSFTKSILTNKSGPAKPRGVLLLGVPGSGKSAFAKALGNEIDRPTLLLDMGALMGSLVGQTEANIRQALAQADAMQPCVLMVDEVEKALAGSGGGDHDSGVAKRMFGTFLTWLNDHESDVFMIATCNDISSLPPEFARAERWDAIFFMDLPSAEEKAAIWAIYGKEYDIGEFDWTPDSPPDIADDEWTGAEIKACCRLAALMDVPLQEAAKYIVPVATTAEGKISALRHWAMNRAISASYAGRYRGPDPSPQMSETRTRKVLAK